MDESFQQNVIVKYKLEELICLLDLMHRLYDTIVTK